MGDVAYGGFVEGVLSQYPLDGYFSFITVRQSEVRILVL